MSVSTNPSPVSQLSSDIRIAQRSAAPELLESAARVFYEAFTLKVDHLELRARSAAQALRVLQRSFYPPQGLFALRGDEVVGMLGLDEGLGRSFLRFELGTLIAEFGLLGGLGRALWLGLLRRLQRPEHGALRIEAVAVAAAARGHGVGTRLLEQAVSYARGRGYRALVLEVVDVNVAARRLYERLGFETVGFNAYGPLTARAGFCGVYRMRKPL